MRGGHIHHLSKLKSDLCRVSVEAVLTIIPVSPGNIGVREDDVVQVHLNNLDPVEQKEGVCLFIKGVYIKLHALSADPGGFT